MCSVFQEAAVLLRFSDFDAVIFDMDGLMVDSEPVWRRSWEISFAHEGLAVVPGFMEALTGSSPAKTRELTDKYYSGSEAARRAYDEHYEVVEKLFVEEGAPKKEGLDELLDLLASRDIPMAVASGSSRSIVEAVLGHAGVLGFFSTLKTGDMGFPSKPAPDVFIAAAVELGSKPIRTVVLEDSPSGIFAASAGGFIPVMVPDIVKPDDELRSMATVYDSLTDFAKGLAG